MSTGQRAAGAPASGALAGFTRIREVAEAHMDKRDLAGDGWSEEGVTEAAVIEGRPEVDVVTFNRHEEGHAVNGLGADYLWWWIDSATDECFGMLVQAKRLKREGRVWHVDIRHGNGRQFGHLLRTADDLKVPAVYSVYTGGRVFREPLGCPHRGEPAQATPPEQCQSCRRMAISMITAYELSTERWSPKATAELILSGSVPVEDLVDPDLPSPPVWDLNLRALTDPQLRDFLLKPQGGAREVARRIFRLAADRRSGQFRAASAEPVRVDGAPIFADVPDDRGHFPGPYYRHILQGLRTQPPGYVETLRRPPTAAELRDLSQDPAAASRMVTSMGPSSWRRLPAELRGTNVAGVVLINL